MEFKSLLTVRAGFLSVSFENFAKAAGTPAICGGMVFPFDVQALLATQRWIACQVEDRIEFGLDPGGELKISETICDEIRDSGTAVVFDDASDDIRWSRHPVPVLYGFKSYCSFPVYLDDGSFWGNLCAIDPEPRHIEDQSVIAMFTNFAKSVGTILSERGAVRL